MRKITFYTKPNCPLCDQSRLYLRNEIAATGGANEWQVEELNILDDPELYRKFRYVIPVVDVEGIGPLPAPASLDPQMLRRMLTTPLGDFALQSEAATLLQQGQFSGETDTMQSAFAAGEVPPTAEQEQRHELYEQLVNTLDAPLESVVGAVDAEAKERGAISGSAVAPVGAQPTGYPLDERGWEVRQQPPGPSTPPPPELPFPTRMPMPPPAPYDRGPLGFLDRFAATVTLRWLLIANVFVGIYAILPWTAPFFSKLGLWGISDAIDTIYLFLCHQLPERTAHIFGYEVANCWRCDALYGSILIGGLIYSHARKNPKGLFGWMSQPLAWQLFLVALIPIGLDGITHMLGLRETNAWFDSLTNGAFGSFSVGDSEGTLNWWLRIFTGALMGFSAVWLIFPYLDRASTQSNNPYLTQRYAAAV